MIKKSHCLLFFLLLCLPVLAQKKKSKRPKKVTVTENVVDTLRPTAFRTSGKPVSGNASVYDLDLDGSKTASGETFSNIRLTAASNDFPLNSWIRASNPKNGKYALLRVNDRLSSRLRNKGIVMRLSQEGARKLGVAKNTLFKIKVELILVNDSSSLTSNPADSSANLKDVLPVTDSLTPNSFEVIGQAVNGIASFYSYNLDGTQTSTGERYRNNLLTAASNNFKLNTWVLVTNLKNRKSVIVRINDHMHPRMKRKGRVVDMSREAARQLDYIDDGLVKVKVEPIRFIYSREMKQELDSLHRNNADSALLTDSPKADSIPVVPAENFVTGIAGVYSTDLDGKKTATGQVYRNTKLSAASNDFDLNTWVRVTNLDNDRSVIVHINDRLHSPVKQKGRVLDLSRAAAKKLNFRKKGLAKVKVELVDKGTLN